MQVPEDVVRRAAQLRAAITEYRSRFHAGEEVGISDEALDSLKHELSTIEQEYPDLRTPDSPTQKVVGAITSGLQKVRHHVPQWSLDDAFDESELAAFHERVVRGLERAGITEPPRYTCEPKIDGLHIVLTYERGVLTTAATRGDGVVGEDVTHNVRTIPEVLETLLEPVDLIVEGEVYMTRSGFIALNKDREKKGEPLFANPRNAAAGSVRQLDSKIAAGRPIHVFLYDVDAYGHEMPRTQSGELELIQKLGLPSNPHFLTTDSLAEILAYWKEWQGVKREEVDYQIDGIVVKVEDIAHQEALGYTGKGPRFSVALKFPAEQVTTIVRDITLQVGRTGVLTPVAHMDPVAVAGTVVARATLHNEDFILEKDIRIGDTVVLQKAGDIIPEIVQVLPKFRTGKERKWKFPKKTPLCGGDGEIERVPGMAAYRCKSRGSFGQQERTLAHFAGRNALDIEGLGKKTVTLLMEEGLVGEFDDFFELTRDELLALPGFKEKSADNLLASIKGATRPTLDKFLVGLSILHVGEETAWLLADRFGSIENIQSATKEELLSVPGLGEVVAESVYAWFKEEENKKMLDRLLVHVVPVPIEKVAGGIFSGETVVVTGTLPTLSREEAERLVREHGGNVSSAVSRKTSLLLAGENAGSKLTKAKELSVPVIDEAAFKARLGL